MNFLVIDLETTGLDPTVNEIIEIGAVKIIDGQLSATLQTLVKPTTPVPDEIADLTGIDNDMLQNAPSLNEALRQLADFTDGDFYWVAHNKDFEAGFLNKLFDKPLPWLDTIDLAKILLPFNRYFRLGFLLEQFAIEHKGLHRALADAQGTAELLVLILQQLKELPDKLWHSFMQICRPVNSPLADLLRLLFNDRAANHKIIPDNAIAGLDSAAFGHSFDHDNLNTAYHLPEKEITDFFAQLPDTDFETRDEQIEMSSKVAAAFNNKQLLLAEAGTGTGKSLAYLLPAVLYSIAANQQIIISTNTINLQEQLLKKDIPLLRKELKKQRDLDFQSAVLKGRNNYLCLRKWRQTRENANVDTLALYLRIEHWLTLTATGDYSELNLWGHEQELILGLNAAAESCVNFSCANSRSVCFLQKARRRAAQANILIVNHSLLLSASLCEEDGGGLLPAVHHLIIDEAHQLPAVAERQFSQHFSAGEVTRVLNRLNQYSPQEILLALQKLNQKNSLMPMLEKIATAQKQVYPAMQEFTSATQDIFSLAKPYDRQMRITEQRYNADIWQPFEGAISNFLFIMRQLSTALNELLYEIDGKDNPYISVDTIIAWQSVRNSLNELIQTGQLIVDGKNGQTDEEYVIWLEKSIIRNYHETTEYLQWWVAPEDIRPLLQHYLFADKQSIIFTSATLANNDFSYFIRELGLDQQALPIESLLLPSPFDYQSNARLLLTEEIGDYTKTSELIIQQQLAEAIAKLVTAAGGKTLVLFTSYQQLNGVYHLLLPMLRETGIKLLAHGTSGGRNFIIETMQKNPNCCVLGVNSFWEGVDIKGDNLSLLIIVRLPFAPPNTPLLEAKFERIKGEGGNPFRDYSLPQAVLRFKQGFGRLIRSKGDKGICCVLDQRICNPKGYGVKFLSAIPNVPIKHYSVAEMAQEITNFLADN